MHQRQSCPFPGQPSWQLPLDRDLIFASRYYGGGDPALGTEGSSPYRALGGLEAGRDQVTCPEMMRLCEGVGT